MKRRNHVTPGNRLAFSTNVPVCSFFQTPLQIRHANDRIYIIASSSGPAAYGCFRWLSSQLSFIGHYGQASLCAIDTDSSYIYTGRASGNDSTKIVYRYSLSSLSLITSGTIRGIRMIDARDVDYLYVSSNDGTDGHGFRQVKKSTLAVTASELATGNGDGQFDDPSGIFYYNSEVFVADYDNSRISVWTKSGETLTYNRKYDLGFKPMDLAFDGTNWYVQSATTLYKYDASFTDATKVSTACVGYSLTIVPDQGDGNGQTIAISNNISHCVYLRKCEDLSLVRSVGSNTVMTYMADPTVTGPSGIWRDSEGGQYSVSSGADISKSNFSGDYFIASHAKMTYKPDAGGLAAITAIDFNTDGIVGEIRNLHKCVNLTSCKLQTNPALSLDLSRLSAKLQTLWAYACGAGIRGSIRHMTALTSVNLRENGASQAQVDQWIGDLYANKDIMAPGTANFNGTNSAPSATGKAQADELVADYAWTITYSA